MNTEDTFDLLQTFPLASCLTDGEIRTLCRTGQHRIYQKHELIYQVGEESDEIFFLLQGVAKIIATSTDGREVIKIIQHPISILSEQSLAGEEYRTNNAMVLTSEACVLAVKVETIKSMMLKNPRLAICVINFIGKRLKYSEERLESLALLDARERIIDFLKANAVTFGQQVGYELLLKHEFTQQDIANFTGTSRQTVTTVLNDLRKKNKIHFKRKSILIRDIASLA
ncbi:MAG: Crp/Fnr family transcriptional regulator [Saprospiraceae bacterium]